MTGNIDALLKKVEKPGRYIGGEFNCIIKDHNKVDTSFAFIFPDLYEIGMSYVGLQILYRAVNRRENLLMERVFCPAKDMEKLMREGSFPLFSIESKTPVKDFDVVGFTLQYEMSFTNILNALDLAGIPLRSKDRGEEYPLVVAGGPCAYNPEPLAPFIDVFMVGDGEECLPDLLSLYGECESREEFYERAVEIDGIYIPALYDVRYNDEGTIERFIRKKPYAKDKVKRAVFSDLEKFDFPADSIVPLVDVVQDRAIVEVFRGCIRGCRFCQAGMIYRPVRERSADTILDIAKEMIKKTGHDEMTLLSLSTSDYSQFEDMAMELADTCSSCNVALSLPSLRLDSFSFKVLGEIQKYRKTGLTFAPEAGSQRLRDIINKNITEEDIFENTKKALELGWRHIKLYFMLGLPEETFEDLDGIAEIAKKIMYISKESPQKGKFSLTVSVSNFVPKAHTPFQWEPQDADFTEKHNYMVKKMKIKGVSFNYHDSPVSKLEAVIARGDRRIADFIESAYRHGCTFDSWTEHFNEEGWIAATEEFNSSHDVDIDFFRTRRRSYDEVLPWDIIDSGISKEFLVRECEKAKNAVTTPDCRTKCSACGITKLTTCPLQEENKSKRQH